MQSICIATERFAFPFNTLEELAILKNIFPDTMYEVIDNKICIKLGYDLKNLVGHITKAVFGFKIVYLMTKKYRGMDLHVFNCDVENNVTRKDSWDDCFEHQHYVIANKFVTRCGLGVLDDIEYKYVDNSTHNRYDDSYFGPGLSILYI
jgi:hypothetical protein